MSDSFETILKEVSRWPAEQGLRLIENLIAHLKGSEQGRPAKTPGKARRHFGAWDSGDERSADNDRIDFDLAREYEDSHRPGT